MSAENPHKPIQSIPPTAQTRYFCIELRGQVDQGWMAAFDPISFSSNGRVTVIAVLADQAGLRGILNRLWDLNLDILSVGEIALPAVPNGVK